MNNCKTCRHWKRREEFESGHSLGLGECRAAPMLWDCTQWDDNHERRTFRTEHENTKSFVQDGSDYKAYLLTKPDFGCVSYEPPPPPTSETGEKL